MQVKQIEKHHKKNALHIKLEMVTMYGMLQ